MYSYVLPLLGNRSLEPVRLRESILLMLSQICPHTFFASYSLGDERHRISQSLIRLSAAQA